MHLINKPATVKTLCIMHHDDGADASEIEDLQQDEQQESNPTGPDDEQQEQQDEQVDVRCWEFPSEVAMRSAIRDGL